MSKSSTMRRYAEDTSVPISRTREQIETMLRRAGASRVILIDEPLELVVMFMLADRLIKLTVPIAGDAKDQVRRARWRAAHMVVKSKLEASATGIETVEAAWLAHVVLPDGSTVGERIGPALQLAYDRGEMPTDPLRLEGPK